jgi:hypothetical protein
MGGKTPRNMTVREAAAYWDTHSVADHPSRVIAVEYSPEEETGTVIVGRDLLCRLARLAKRQGVTVEDLLNLWIQEKLTA